MRTGRDVQRRAATHRSLNHSRTNDPDPRDVVVVRMMMSGDETHGRNVMGR